MSRKRILPRIPWHIQVRRGFCARNHPLHEKTMGISSNGYGYCKRCKAEGASLTYDTDKQHERNKARGRSKTRRKFRN